MMLRRGWFLAVMAVFALTCAGYAEWEGKYILTEKTPAGGVMVYSVEITRNEQGQMVMSGGVARASGSSAAPDFQGVLDKEKQGDAYVGAFRDSFSNKGMVRIKVEKGAITMSFDITEVVDDRSLSFYETIRLRRVEN